jgi:hypothetical protein
MGGREVGMNDVSGGWGGRNFVEELSGKGLTAIRGSILLVVSSPNLDL